MISLVVTVIVVVILAMMIIQTSSSLPSDATYVKFAEELTSVEGAIESIRTQNAGKGDSEEQINAGFRKVTLRNAPGGFESFDSVGVDTTGYIVDLNIIGYGNAAFGQDYDEGKTEIEFLKDDIYVYDATGTVYYAKGIEYKSEIIHTLLEGMDLGLESTADGPIITNVTVTSGELSDGTKTSGKAKITISAFPRYSGDLTVMVRNIIAEKMPNGTFVAQVSRNGIYTIVVTEKDGGRTIQRVNVTGIVEMNEVPSNLSMVVNSGEGFTTQRIVDIILRADGATKMMITKDNPLRPTSSDDGWIDYKTNIEFDLGSTEKRITLYAWFKDEFANVTDQIVKATIVYDKTPPSITKPTVIESGPYVILTANQKDNIAADTYLLSKTEYGYRIYDGVGGYEDDYTWQNGNLIGPLTNRVKYEFVTRTVDEAGNKSVSEPSVHTVAYDYIINFDLQGGTGNVETVYASAGDSIEISVENPTKMGYVFVGWSEKQDALPTDEVDVIMEGEKYTPTGSDVRKTLYAIWSPRTDMEYKVHHYVERQDVLGEYELKLTETFTGTVGKLAYATPKTEEDFFGFVENEFHSQRLGMAEIKGDGSTELRLYYYRGKFNLTVLGENASVIGTMVDVPYEAEVQISAIPNSGYDFDRWVIEGTVESSEEYKNFVNEHGRWSQNATFKMLGRNTTIIAKTGIKKFAITYELNRGVLPVENPTEYTRETPAFTLNNPTKTGYAFAGWTGTDLIQNTINVTVDPLTLVNIQDRHYEAVFVPTDDLLTITANPSKPTNTTVRAIIECLDPALRLEYRVGSEGTWDMYVSSIPINENTTVYARVLDDGMIIDEEALVINNIDTVSPEILDISISEKWNPGEELLVKVTAEDNIEIKGYAVTTTNIEPHEESYETGKNEIELEEGINYIWVSDTAGNVVSKAVHAWDISERENGEIYAFLKEEKELIIVGTGKTKSYQESNIPYQFYKEKIEIVKIEEGITILGNHILSSMKKVSEIYFPSTLSEIMEDSMLYTNRFEKIEIAEGNDYFAYDKYTLYDKDKTMIYIHSAADEGIDYIVPTTVETIKKFAFYDNDNLNKVITTSNPTVGESAFEDCDDLYQIDGEIGGTTIAVRAFAECQNLHLITLSSELKDLGAASFANTVKLSVLEIPKSLETIVDEIASQKGVFTNIGVYNEGAFPKGVIRYYQSTKVIHTYATKYSTEAIFEMIDDIAPEFVKLGITSPQTGTYAREQEITIVAEFSEELGIDETTVVPELVIKIGDGEEKEVATAVIEGNKITYTYIVTEEDEGKLELVSYKGSVQDLAGNRTDVDVTAMTGSEIVINTAIEMYEDDEIEYFASLQEAIDAARTDGEGRTTIRLLKNIDENVSIAANKDIILDLNGLKLTTTESAPVIINRAKLEINSYGTLTSEGILVKNEGNSTLTVSHVTLETLGANQSAITGEVNSVINIENIIVVSKGVTVETRGKLNVNSASIITETGPAINLIGTAQAILTDATIESHVGYAINISTEATVEISSGIITATGGVAINNNNILKLLDSCHIVGTGGIISNKTLEIYDAIIEGTDGEKSAIENTGTVKMYGGKITSATNIAVSNVSGTFEMSDGYIEATGLSKDAVRNNAGAQFKMTKGEIYSKQGSALYNLGFLGIEEDAQLTSEGAITLNNKAELTITGGTIYSIATNGTAIENSGTTSITNGTIISQGVNGISNVAEGDLSLEKTSITVTASGDSNGINLSSIGKATINDSTVYVDSTANNAKGILLEIGTSVDITNSTITAIATNGTGYGIYNKGGNVTIGKDEEMISENNPVVEGSHIGYYSTEGILNYYDGNFIGSEDNSIKGTVTNKPQHSYIVYTLTEGREKSNLEIDIEAPTNVNLIASTTEWTNKIITIFGEGTDEGSGIIEYAITHTETEPASNEWIKLDEPQKEFSTTFTVTECNKYYLHVKDQTGNVTVSNSVETKYDAIAPKIDSIEKIPSAWTSGDVTIKLNATDTISGIIGYEFSKVYHDLNTKGEGYASVDPAAETIEQTYVSDNAKIYIYVYDQAGNVAYDEIEIDNVDKIKPTINVEFVEYKTTAAIVKVTAKDYESGIDSIYMNNVEQTVTDIESGKTATCIIDHSGTIEFKATDNVGNEIKTTIEAYVITYNANGGEGTIESQIKLKDHNRTIVENTFTRDKYQFVNWNTSHEGTGTVYNPGDEYSGNESLALYAIWKDIEPPRILDVMLSPNWVAGSDILLRIFAEDNVDVSHYGVTTTTSEPTNWSTNQDITITLGNEVYYVWVKDPAGNTKYVEVDIYDLSEPDAPKTVVGIVKPNGETELTLSIEGNGAIKDLIGDLASWNSKISNITTVIVTEGITEIGSKALSGLTSANVISLPSTVTTIELDAFMHTNNYSTFTVEGEKFRVEQGILYDASGTNLYVASAKTTTGNIEILLTVQTIAPYAFENSVVTELTISENINLPEGAFYNAKNLSKITANKGIGGTEIGASAFEGCTSLAELNLSQSLETIGSRAFYGTTKLNDIVINKTLKTIEGTEVFVNIGTMAGTDTGKGYVYYYESNDVMSAYATNSATRNQATFVGIDDILPVVEEVLINDGAVITNNNTVKVNVTASDNHEVVEMYITEDETVDPRGTVVDWIEYTEESQYVLSSGIGEKTIYVWVKDNSGNVSEVSKSATIIYTQYTFEFKGESEIVQYVDTTGKDYYEYRDAGYELIGENVTAEVNGTVNHATIGTYEIEHTVKYDGIDVETFVRTVDIIPNTWDTTVRIEGDFRYVIHTTGEYVKIIGYTNSSNSNTLEIPNTIVVNGKDYKVIDIGDGTNSISSTDAKVATVILPSNIIAVSDNAFSTFIELGNLIYQDNLMTIGAYAFANSNSSYTDLTIKNNVREVKQGAFNNSKIHNIVIEEGVKAIYENAFYSRNNVAEGQILEIPATIDYIGTKAFYGYKASEIDVNEFNVKYADIDGELLTNIDGTVVYQYALGREESTCAIPDGIITIAEGAFAESPNLTQVELSNSVTELGHESFMNAALLEYVRNIQNLEHVGEGAFENTSLLEFEIPSKLQEILANTFKNTNIEKIYIPENITSIGSGAYGNCSSLREVIFEKAITIAGDTFKGSSTLQYILVFDETEMITVTNTLNMPNNTKVYVLNKTLETAYESDSNWMLLGNNRILCIAELNGEAEIELVNDEQYLEEGITLVGEIITSGQSTQIEGLEVELTTTLNESLVGEYVITYSIKYNSETILELTRTVRVTDIIPPIITSITTDSSWTSGTNLKLRIEANDNRGDSLKFAVTNTENTEGAIWSEDSVVTLSVGMNYINVRDDSNNIATAVVKVWDISKDKNQTVIAYEKEDGELIITGSGETTNLVTRGETPWKDDVTLITKLTLEEGITHLGEYILSGLENVAEITIPNTLDNSNNVAGSAFAGTNNFNVINIDENNGAFILDNQTTLLSKDGERIYIHSRRDERSSIVIGSNVKYISDSAYYMNNMLEELELTALVEIDKAAFEACLNLGLISGEVGNAYIENAAFSGDINLGDIIISKTVENLGTGIFTNVLGPVYYYASSETMNEYVETYPDETEFIVIDDIGPTDDAPTVRVSSSTIVITANQTDEISEMVLVEYNYRKDGEEYVDDMWKSEPYFTGLDANTKYFVKTRATDSAGNLTESKEAEIVTEKVPETIEITATPSTPTNGDVAVIIEWPVEDMEKLYGEGWPEGTSVTKQIGIANQGDINIMWIDITDTASYYQYNVTQNNTTIFARLYDGYNYTAQAVSLTVGNIDRVAPTGTIVINDGDKEILDHKINLTLSATDDRTEEGYGVKYYYVSENASVDLSTVMWNSYSDGVIYEYTLTGNTSLKTLYVWYMDAAGNISEPASDSVMLVTGVAKLEENGVVSYYDTLTEAIAATTNSPTTGASKITLIRNVSQEGNLIIGKEKNIVLDMNGMNISQTSTTDVTAITNEGILRIINSVEDNSAIYAITTSGNAYGIYNTGLLDVTTVSIIAETASGTGIGIYNQNTEG